MSTALVVGSANADLVYSVDRFPQPGETISAKQFTTFAGGKGANQAVAAARSGAIVDFCASLGNDSNGDFLAQTISENCVSLRHTRRSNQPTGTAIIFVNQEAENEIVLNPGANFDLTADDVQSAIDQSKPNIILAQLEITNEAIRQVLHSKSKTILNPAPFRDLTQFDINGLFAITPNETETYALTGILPQNEESIRNAANVILKLGIQNAIVTLGKRGCYWSNGVEELFIPAPSVAPVDTTGAGDVFNGALLAQLLRGNSFPDALQFAVAAASLSTTRPGALTSAPFAQETQQFLTP
jgi:ribokinase